MRLLQPNLTYDEKRSDDLYRTQLAELDQNPIVKTFRKGDAVTRKGAALTQLQAEALIQINTRSLRANIVKFVGVAGITAIFFLAAGLYFAPFSQGRGSDGRQRPRFTHCRPVLAIGFGQILTAAGGNSADRDALLPGRGGRHVVGDSYVAPGGFHSGAYLQLPVLAVVNGQELSFLVLALFGGFTAVLSSRQIRRRVEVLRVGLQVGFINVIAVTVLTLINKKEMPILTDIGVAMLNGVACAFATGFLLAVFESAFGHRHRFAFTGDDRREAPLDRRTGRKGARDLSARPQRHQTGRSRRSGDRSQRVARTRGSLLS